MLCLACWGHSRGSASHTWRPPHTVAVGGLAFVFMCAQCLSRLLLFVAWPLFFPLCLWGAALSVLQAKPVCYWWFLGIRHFPLWGQHIVTAWMTTAGKPSLAWNEAIAFKTAMWETASMNWSSLLILLNVTAQLSHSGYPHVGREQKNHHLVQSLPKRYFGSGFLPWGNNLHLLVTSVEPWVKNKTADENKTSQRRICFR